MAAKKVARKLNAAEPRKGERKLNEALGEINSWGEGVELVAEFVKIKPLRDGQLLIVDVEGERQTWGCPTALNSILTEAEVEPGATLRIVCTGKRQAAKKGHQPYWMFDVFCQD